MPNSHLYYTANAITFVSKWRLQGLFKSVIKLPFFLGALYIAVMLGLSTEHLPLEL